MTGCLGHNPDVSALGNAFELPMDRGERHRMSQRRPMIAANSRLTGLDGAGETHLGDTSGSASTVGR
jgi:hypothetical protein